MPFVYRRIPKCSHCQWEWLPRLDPGKKRARQLPRRCPRCKTPNWNQPRVYAQRAVAPDPLQRAPKPKPMQFQEKLRRLVKQAGLK